MQHTNFQSEGGEISERALLEGDFKIIPSDLPMDSSVAFVEYSYRELIPKTFRLVSLLTGYQLVAVSNSISMGVILSKHENDLLASMPIILASQIAVTVIFTSPLFYISTMIGQFEQNSTSPFALKKIGNIVQQGWIVSLLTAIASVSIIQAIPGILTLAELPEVVVSNTQEYYQSFVYAIPAYHLMMASQQFLNGLKRPILPLVISLIDLGVFSLLGFYFASDRIAMFSGSYGLGAARTISLWLSFVLMHFLIWYQGDVSKFRLCDITHRERWVTFCILIKKGLPIGLNLTAELGAMFINSILIGRTGLPALETDQVAGQYRAIAVCPILGIEYANTINIANSMTSPRNIKKYFLSSSVIGVGINSLLMLLGTALYKEIGSIYIKNSNPDYDSIYDNLQKVIIIASIYNYFDLLRSASTGALRGMGETFRPMLINGVSILVLGISSSYFLGFLADWGLVGINIGLGIGLACAATGNSLLLKSQLPNNLLYQNEQKQDLIIVPEVKQKKQYFWNRFGNLGGLRNFNCNLNFFSCFKTTPKDTQIFNTATEVKVTRRRGCWPF